MWKKNLENLKSSRNFSSEWTKYLREGVYLE